MTAGTPAASSAAATGGVPFGLRGVARIEHDQPWLPGRFGKKLPDLVRRPLPVERRAGDLRLVEVEHEVRLRGVELAVADEVQDVRREVPEAFLEHMPAFRRLVENCTMTLKPAL